MTIEINSIADADSGDFSQGKRWKIDDDQILGFGEEFFFYSSTLECPFFVISYLESTFREIINCTSIKSHYSKCLHNKLDERAMMACLVVVAFLVLLLPHYENI